MNELQCETQSLKGFISHLEMGKNAALLQHQPLVEQVLVKMGMGRPGPGLGLGPVALGPILRAMSTQSKL